MWVAPFLHKGRFLMITALDAVNRMLTMVGERPVATLDATVVTNASLAYSTLLETSKEVQTSGFEFNTDTRYTLEVAGDGGIAVPENVLSLNPSYRGIDITLRGRWLYDRANHTYTFTEPQQVDIVWYLEWDELPDAAQQYIVVRAGRQFSKNVLGTPEVANLNAEQEQKAMINLLVYDNDQRNPNLMDNIPGTFRRKYTR